MSSQVSVRSYVRRKSAEGRLETPLHPLDEQKPRVSRRVKSALETKREHEASSEVLPGVTKDETDSAWGKTHYSLNYCRKKPIAHAPVRIASPTRRNNPHPSEVRASSREGAGLVIGSFYEPLPSRVYS